ncbi:MAG: molecular chaperone Tir [Kiritimatiellae bacterium]|nr:molecular chaperone Tir [Kiritimatiellia bacterium]
MSDHLEKVKNYLFELGYEINVEDSDSELVVITDESRGIKNLVIDCEAPILIFEQLIFELKNDDPTVLKKLMQWNREVVHGAFVLDDSGKKVLFRDTLQLENLDLNELEASIDSLGVAMAEYSEDIIKFAKS